MKEYIKPFIEFTNLEVQDIMSASVVIDDGIYEDDNVVEIM